MQSEIHPYLLVNFHYKRIIKGFVKAKTNITMIIEIYTLLKFCNIVVLYNIMVTSKLGSKIILN